MASWWLAIAGGLYFRSHKAQALTEKDAIVLADFVNTTGDPVFDGTLRQALAVQLGQSPYLNIFPQERVRETLRYMGRSPDERVTPDLARQVCQREGIKAVLNGSITSIGSQYVVGVDAMNCQTGDTWPASRSKSAGRSKCWARSARPLRTCAASSASRSLPFRNSTRPCRKPPLGRLKL